MIKTLGKHSFLFLLAVCLFVTCSHTSKVSNDDIQIQEKNIPLIIAKINDVYINSGTIVSHRIQLLKSCDSVMWNLDTASKIKGITINTNGEVGWTAPIVTGTEPLICTVTVYATNTYDTSSATFKIHTYANGTIPPIIHDMSIIGNCYSNQKCYITLTCKMTSQDTSNVKVMTDLSIIGGDDSLALLYTGDVKGISEYSWFGTVEPKDTGVMNIELQATCKNGTLIDTLQCVVKAIDSSITSTGDTIILSALKLGGPGAILISKGKSTCGSMAVSKNTLVGILKDSVAYLYHPSLGNAALSHYNSRRALGYFIQSIDLPSKRTLESIHEQSEYYMGDTSVIKTGIKTYSKYGGVSYLNNTQKRWHVAKSPKEQRYFLAPTSQIGKVFGSKNVGVIIDKINTFTSGSGVVDDGSAKVNGTPVKAYASVVRVLPAIFNTRTWAEQIASYLPSNFRRYLDVTEGQSVGPTITKAQLTTLSQKTKIAMQDDQELFIQLNILDLGIIISETVKAVSSLTPVEGFDLVIGALTNNIIQSAWTIALTDFEPKHIANCTFQTAVQVLVSFWGAAGETVTGPVFMVLNTSLDILSLFCWVHELDAGFNQTLQFDAFDIITYKEKEIKYGNITGTVVDMDDGNPISGAHIVLKGDENNPITTSHDCRTKNNGVFQFENIMTGSKTIEIYRKVVEKVNSTWYHNIDGIEYEDLIVPITIDTGMNTISSELRNAVPKFQKCIVRFNAQGQWEALLNGEIKTSPCSFSWFGRLDTIANDMFTFSDDDGDSTKAKIGFQCDPTLNTYSTKTVFVWAKTNWSNYYDTLAITQPQGPLTLLHAGGLNIPYSYTKELKGENAGSIISQLCMYKRNGDGTFWKLTGFNCDTSSSLKISFEFK